MNINKIIRESIQHVLNESAMPEFTDKCFLDFKGLVDQVNQTLAYLKNQYGDMTLMRRNREIYSMDAPVVLSFNDRMDKIECSFTTSDYGSKEDFDAYVMQVVNGKCKPIKDEMQWDDDYYSLKRKLKSILADAQRTINDFENYDPNVEDNQNANWKEQLQDINQRSGFNKNAGVADNAYRRRFENN